MFRAINYQSEKVNRHTWKEVWRSTIEIRRSKIWSLKEIVHSWSKIYRLRKRQLRYEERQHWFKNQTWQHLRNVTQSSAWPGSKALIDYLHFN